MPPEDPPAPAQSRLMMWLALVAIVAAVGVSVVVGVRAGLLLLSAALLAFAVVRAVSPTAPYGLTIRSRAFDVTLLVAGALVITGVTFTLPTSALG